MLDNPFFSCGLGEFAASKKLLNTALCADGIFQHRKNLLGNFYYCLDDKTKFDSFGIDAKGKIAFERDEDSLPKIPGTLLTEIVRVYREVSKTISAEVFIAIVWDKIKKDYFLHLPVQTVSGASIDYTKTDEIYNNNDLFVVMDTH